MVGWGGVGGCLWVMCNVSITSIPFSPACARRLQIRSSPDREVRRMLTTTSDVGNSTTGPGGLCPRVLHNGGALHLEACCRWCCSSSVPRDWALLASSGSVDRVPGTPPKRQTP